MFSKLSFRGKTNIEIFKNYILYFLFSILLMIASVISNLFPLFVSAIILGFIFLFISCLFLLLSIMELIFPSLKRNNKNNRQLQKLKNDLYDLKAEQRMANNNLNNIRREINNLKNENIISFVSTDHNFRFFAYLDKINLTFSYNGIELPLQCIKDVEIDSHSEFISSSSYNYSSNSNYKSRDTSVFIGNVGLGGGSLKGTTVSRSSDYSVSKSIDYYDVIITTNVLEFPILIVKCGTDRELALKILNALIISKNYRVDNSVLNRIELMLNNEKELNRLCLDIEGKIRLKKEEIKINRKERD